MADTMPTFNQVMRFLRYQCPPDHPVQVRRLSGLKEMYGDCDLKKSGKKQFFKIRINKDYDEDVTIDTLMHEWAHTVAWHKCTKEDHCNEWGKAYSKIYRMFLKEFF